MAKQPDSEATDDNQLFSLRLPRQLWAELGVLARLRGKPLNRLLIEVLQAYWNEQPEKTTVARLVKTAGAARKRAKGEPE